MSAAPPVCPQCGSASRVAGDLCAGCLFDLAMSDVSSSPLDELAYDRGIPAAGQDFAGYELQAVIGRSMALVYRAVHRQSGRVVALKMVPPQQLHDDSVRERFKTEVQAAAALDHPNILPIYDVGERDGLPFFSMKFADCGALSERSSTYRRKFHEIARLIAKVARALHHAHQRGILHRDVKPGNILLDGAGEPFLADFGIAKSLASDVDLTRTLSVLGTPAYLSPEQAAGKTKELTTATDIYGLGAVLYELLAGHPPFGGKNAVEILHEIERKSPERPTLHDASIPRDLEIICWKCLAKDPRDRYPTANALAEDLERWNDGRTIIARAATPPERLWRWSRRNPALASLSAVLLAGLFTAAVVSSFAAVRFRGISKRALAAEADAMEKLRDSYLAQAIALRATPRMGHRFETLAVLAKAAKIRPGLDLRNEAIAALNLVDFRVEKMWSDRLGEYCPTAFDAKLERYALEVEPGVIAVKRTADQSEIIRFAPPGPKVRPIYIAPWNSDGNRIAVRYSNDRVRVYDLAANSLAFELTERPACGVNFALAYDFGFTPDGTELAVGLPEGGVSFHDSSTGKETGRLRTKTIPACLAISPSGKLIALVGPKELTIEIYERASGKLLQSATLPAWLVHFVWSPDEKQIAAACYDDVLYLIDAASGATVRSFRGHENTPSLLAFHPSGRYLASTARDDTVRLWNVATGEQLVRTKQISAEPGLRFSSDGARIAVSSFDTKAGILDLAVDDPVREIFRAATVDRFSGEGAMSLSADGRLILLSNKSALRIFDAHDGSARFVTTEHAGVWKNAQFAPATDAYYLAGDDFPVERHSLHWKNPNELEAGPAETIDPRPGFRVLEVHPDPLRLVLSSDVHRAVAIINPGEPAKNITLENLPEVSRATLSPDGRWLGAAFNISGDVAEGDPRLWDASTGKLVRIFKDRGNGDVSFSPGGHFILVMGGKDDPARNCALRLPDFTACPQLPVVTTGGYFSRDDSLLAAEVDADMALIRTSDWKLLGVLPCGISAMARFSPDGRILYAVSGPRVVAWDLTALGRELSGIGLDWN